jgi:NTE family protein
MELGLALSGGGVRALIFHLGVIGRLAKGGLLEDVTFLSTVSGGTLAAGLIYCTASHTWPSSVDYLDVIVESIRERLTSSTVQWSYTWRSLVFPWRLLRGRAHLLGGVIAKQWGISADLSDLPHEPRWVINATCYETGKNWRFSQPRMGDYQTQYVFNPRFSLSDALAASAAVPGLIGPLRISSSAFHWQEFSLGSDRKESAKPLFPSYNLWDGGIYDNLGVEPLFKPAGGLRDGVDFLIVSDASKPLGHTSQSWKTFLRPGKPFLRLVDIATDQVRALRSRAVVSYFQRFPASGVYLRMGNTTSAVYQKAKQSRCDINQLSEKDVRAISGMETTLRRVTGKEFNRLYRHGFEVADATLCAYQSDRFSPIQFTN